MKKLVCIFMLSLLLVMATMPAMAESDSMDSRIQINAMSDNLSPEEIEEIDKEADAKYEKLLKKLEQREERQPRNGEVGIQWYYEEETDLGVPKHKQQENNWCGPASALSVIDYNGEEDAVDGSSEYEKQETLADEIGTVKKGSFTPNIRDVLDDYIDDFNWAAKRIDDDDYNGLWNIIDGNINDWSQPVIVLVDTSYLPYYKGEQYLHYIVVDGLTQVIDDSTSKPVKSESTVSIVDPNNQSNSYYGNRTVKFNDLFDAAVGYFDDGEQHYNLVW